jgi:hypothetical protein
MMGTTIPVIDVCSLSAALDDDNVLMKRNIEYN